MKQISTEKLIEKLGVEVYPITLVKFILNKRRILNYFRKASDPNFEIRVKYTVDHSDCKQCHEKASEGVLCRQHTSIQRVLTAENLAFDLDTNIYFYQNEIFRKVGDKLVIVYCPHPKLIKGPIEDHKVRKVNPITIEDPELPTEFQYDNVKEFLSTELMEQNLRCWFNDEFSIVTIPNDRNKSDWCLVPNR